MENNKKLIWIILMLIPAGLTTFALYMIEKGSAFVFSFLLIAFWYLYWKVYCVRKSLEKVKGIAVFSLFLGICFVVGNIVINGYNFEPGLFGYLKAVLGVLGYAPLYYVFLTYAYKILHTPRITKFTIPQKVTDAFCKNPFRFSFIVIMICWAAHLVIKYPAGMCWDASYQIEQGLGNSQLTTHHPIAHTFLMTAFVRFGQLLGSANIGLFLFVVIEAIVGAICFAYVMSFLHRIKTHTWCKVFAMAYFCFSPYIMGYVGQPIKDFYYSVFCVLFIMMLAEYVMDTEAFWKKKKNLILFLVSTMGVVLFRNNGTYILIPTMLVLICYEIKRRKNTLRHVALLFLICVLPLAASKGLKIIAQPEPGSIAEALSFPFQQTARLVTYHEDSITEEEKEIISKVLPYDELPDLYDEFISDPVKAEYNRDATSEDLKAYLVVWAKQFLREPGCYVEATVCQNIFLFYPAYNNYRYYVESSNMIYPFSKEEIFTTPEWIKQFQPLYHKVLKGFHEFPLFYFVNNMAIYVILVVAMLFFILKDKDKKQLLYLLPMYLSLVIVVLAPVVRGNTRYVYPVLYAIPLMIGVYCARTKQNEKRHF